MNCEPDNLRSYDISNKRMQIIETVKDMQAFSRRFRSEGKGIGFVPTMGAFHDGHLSLVKRSVDDNNLTVVSIFC